MKKMLFGFVLGCAIILSNAASADQQPTPPKAKTEASSHEGFNVFKAFRKGGRGLANITTSPFEVPNQMVKEAKRHDTVGGAISGYFAGIPIGCGWMVYRLGVGVFDFVTGPVPIPTYEKTYIQPTDLFPQDPYMME